MLIITTVEQDDGFSPLWRFPCPECERLINFYSVAQKQCPNCMTHFQFAPGQLMKNEEARVSYHVDNN